MPKISGKYIVTWSQELYIRINNKMYKHYPDNVLTMKKDITRVHTETNNFEEALYAAFCSGCYDEVRCHEDAYQRCSGYEDTPYGACQAALEYPEEDI